MKLTGEKEIDNSYHPDTHLFGDLNIVQLQEIPEKPDSLLSLYPDFRHNFQVSMMTDKNLLS